MSEATAVSRRISLEALIDTIEPRLRELEARRLRLGRVVIGGAVLCAAVPAAGLWAVGAVVGAPWLVGGGSLVAGLLAWGGARATEASYAADYKRFVIARLLTWLAPTLHYEAKTVMLREAFKTAGFLPAGHIYTMSEDLVDGTIDGRRVAFCELRATTHQHDDHGGEAAGTTKAFSGLFFRVALASTVLDHVLVVPERPWLPQERAGDAARRKVVELDDPAFQAALVVYARDAGAARAILRPAVRQELLTLADGRQVYAAWRDRYMYVGLTREGAYLEPSLRTSALAREPIRRFAADLEAAIETIRRLAPALGGLEGSGGQAVTRD